MTTQRRIVGRPRTVTDEQIAIVRAWKRAGEMRAELGVSESSWDMIRKGYEYKRDPSRPEVVEAVRSWKTAVRLRHELGLSMAAWNMIRSGYHFKNQCPLRESEAA